MKLRALLLAAAMVIPSLGVGLGVAVLGPVSPAAANTYVCGSFTQGGPSLTVYGIEGTAACHTGSAIELVTTCIYVNSSPFVNQAHRDQGGGPGGTSCDTNDNSSGQITFGYVQTGCNYYWVETYYYIYAYHAYSTTDSGALYTCH